MNEQFGSLVSRAAASLSSFGLKKEDRVAFPAHANWSTIYLLFASWRLSLTAIPFSPRNPSPQLPSCLLIEDPTPLFNTKELYPSHNLDPSFLALMLLTSGSTGTPKWASFTLRQLLDSATVVTDALSAKPQDRWLLSLPLHHVGGIGVLLRAFCSDGTLILEDKNLPYQERITSAQAHFASLVPTQLYRLLQDETFFSSTHFLLGGAPLSRNLYERAKNRGLKLSLTYALTEMSSTVLLSSHPTWHDQRPYLGHPLPGREIKLSEEGEILVRGKSLFEGYGIPPSPPADWLATGDLGHFHEQFGFCIDGRKDFQFISGGENIQPEEIEAALLAHPQVEQAVVVSRPDEEFGARPVAYLRSTLSNEQLIAFLSLSLPKYKIPIAFLPLPENEGLKPNRRKLQESLLIV